MPVWNVNRPVAEFEKGCHVIRDLGDKISALPILLPLSLARISLHEFLCMRTSYIGGGGIFINFFLLEYGELPYRLHHCYRIDC
jgi:hypothetical protein